MMLGAIARPEHTAALEAVQYGSALFVYAILSETLVCEILGHLRTICDMV